VTEPPFRSHVRAPAGGRTGRYLLAYRPGDESAVTAALRDRAGLRAAASRTDLGDRSFRTAGDDAPEVLLLPRLSAAVVVASGDQYAALARLHEHLPVSPPEAERWVTADPAPVGPALQAYLRGYRDGVAAVVERLTAASPATAQADESAATWGLEAVGATRSSRTGAGVRVAVLDTGVDLSHPDLAGRVVETASFVPGEDAVDRLGHGTHCAGTIAGPRSPQGGTRYGVAPDVELYVGKVLGSDGRGREGDVLAGIDWAVERDCRVVSMSLGSPAVLGEPYSAVFEQVAAELAEGTPGTVLVAAAGNDSARSRGRIAPVGRPASCPSVVAVAALDRALQVADFSNAGAGTPGGQVDVAAPGVDVLSAYPEPEGPYVRLDGTSMATPHVAGVLALLAEGRPEATVPALLRALLAAARRLPAASTDVGAGLVQAPA
jgi:subtilisin